MREQIEAGLNAARLDGVVRLSKDKVPEVADYVLKELEKIRSATPPEVGVMPEDTNVLFVGTGDIVASIARAALSNAVKTGDQLRTMVEHVSNDYVTERHLAWGLQSIFGVWTFATPTGMKAAGRYQSLVTFRSVLDALLEAGRPLAEGVDAEADRSAFWHTVGQLVAETDKAKRQIKQAEGETELAKERCHHAWGDPNVIPKPQRAENGHELHDKAVKVLAEAVL